MGSNISEKPLASSLVEECREGADDMFLRKIVTNYRIALHHVPKIRVLKSADVVGICTRTLLKLQSALNSADWQRGEDVHNCRLFGVSGGRLNNVIKYEKN
jgi:hypothetical protein